MPVDDFRKKVNQLTPKVKKILLSNKTFEIISSINAKYRLNPKQQEKIAQIIGKVFIKEVSLIELANALKTQTNLDLETVKSLTFDIVKNLFLPIKQYFPDAGELMMRLKSDQQSRASDSNIVDLKDGRFNANIQR